MKILVVSHSYIVDLNCEKLKALANLESGIEVTIVIPKRWKPGGVMKDTIETRYREEGSFRVVPVSNFSQNNQGLLTFGAELIPLLKSFKPDIIQVEQGAKSLAYAQFITFNKVLNLKAKNVFFTWWNLPYTLRFPVSLLEAYNLKNTDGIIAGNQDGAKILRDRGFLKKMSIMPQLGVDDSLFCPQPQTELAAKLGIQANDFVVGFVGRFVPEKGILTLVKALERLRDRTWKLLLLGRGELKSEIQQQAERFRFVDRLIWVESVPHADVYRYINLMNTLVLPSETTYQFKTLTSAGWKEQFGHVLIEAMACQVPVIGSDSGEIPNVIEQAGLVFPEGNAEELSNRLKQLIDDRNFAEELGQRGYQRAIAKYANRALAKELLEFYRSL
ncbi:hormogonium polysaccharide biosynthesis glycosyltransferase HpsO [Leptolyngbya sp. NIES-2104]|uniref:hormogonium polysaccharide biosynthesis glycosyltransferase HpsO n=1 Tax=Leptolyngbya sp. NIES-2104 TaxID=1552121 RepID=UPI0006EC81FE|nr:hormogonium polysaccharide biosynthesis glycosyltransferase HpsO [Leptolyngbya sp. NIES-2104]GAP95714.1 glycosyltransferase [Leptolyngbya sp. NIES-2104]